MFGHGSFCDIASRFVQNGRDILQNTRLVNPRKVFKAVTYFSFIPGCHTCSQDTVLDTARGEVVEDSMVRIVQNAAIVFHGGCAIEN